MGFRTVARPLPGGRGERLEWYVPFVQNSTVVGSLFTLVHVPFMLAFLSVTVIGAMAAGTPDATVLALSLAVVGLLLYAEHMLDDTTAVGKPWNTVLGDRSLFALAGGLYVLAAAIGAWASIRYSSVVPGVGVGAGIVFTALYGLEVWKFHAVEFGAVGMGAIPAFSYLAQSAAAGESGGWLVAVALFVFGTLYCLVMLSLYEHTKTGDHATMWRLLGYHFLMIYALATAAIALGGLP
ncbi:MAG: hypothetical protein ISF22_03080 [Methanomassiliicoccus sp.]|nr:hypothetical protein [Methanomassiliicoccus sp.]